MVDMFKILSAETLLRMWHELADHLIERGRGSPEDIAVLNRIALAYGSRQGIDVALSGTIARKPNAEEVCRYPASGVQPR